MEPVRSSVTRGLMEGLVLHAIDQEPSHGYGIITQLDHIIGERPNKNQVYPLLHELEEEGLIRSEAIDDGRQKQVYHLTPDGEDRLQEYRKLPQPFKQWLNGLFALPQDAELAPPVDDADQPASTPPSRTSPESASGPREGWVSEALRRLPDDEPIQAPFATLHFDRDPNDGTWTLEVRQHAPGNYEDADRCPLTFLYFAIQQLLFQGHANP